MDWLNIHRKVTDSPEFVGSEPVDRSTWLCLSMFCAGQENGGRIVGCKTWGDRKWQQVVRVTLAEVRRMCDLWTWDGDDLLVTHYPRDKETEVRAKREAGKETARKRWAQREAQQPGEQSHEQPSSVVSSADSSAISYDPKQQDAEGKGREGKGKEEERKQAADAAGAGELPLEPSFPSILNTPEFTAAWADWLAYRRERKLSAYKPTSRATQIMTLASWGHDAAIASIRESIRQQWQGLFPPKNTTTNKTGGHPFQLPKSDHDKKF